MIEDEKIDRRFSNGAGTVVYLGSQNVAAFAQAMKIAKLVDSTTVVVPGDNNSMLHPRDIMAGNPEPLKFTLESSDYFMKDKIEFDDYEKVGDRKDFNAKDKQKRKSKNRQAKKGRKRNRK